MVNVYLSGADARNAAADLWQSDQLKRLNDQFAPSPAPADTAQPPPSAPVEAAGVQGSALPPSATGPDLSQPAPPAAVPPPAPAPALPAAPNPTPDRNDLADHFTRNAVADAWEQNALADVTKGVSQAGAGVQSALADVPKEAQGLVSNYSALPGATPPQAAQPAPTQPAGIPAPQPTQGQVATVAGGGDLQSYARQVAQRNGVDPDIFQRQIQQESGFRTDAVSPAGATGIAQFMPATARGMGVDPTDPYASLDGAARLMSQNLKRYGGDYAKALAAYNAGPGNVDKYGGVPPFEETQRYVKTILGGAGQAVQSVASSVGGALQGVAPAVADKAGALADQAGATGQSWLDMAKSFLGKPYIWGSGSGAGGRGTQDIDPATGLPRGFDCSGFVSYILQNGLGIDLPAQTAAAYGSGKLEQIDAAQAQPGDVVFYNMSSGDPHMQHMALYMGKGKIIEAGGVESDVNVADANAVGPPTFMRPKGGVPREATNALSAVGSVAQPSPSVFGQPVQPKAQDLLSAVSNLAQPVQQTAQGIIGAVGNVGGAIGTTASNIGGALNSPTLPGQIYQNSPIGAFNTATQQIGQNVVSPAIEAITQPGGALIGPRTAAAGALENVASNVPSGVPVVAGALQHAAGMVGGPTVIDQIGMVQDLANKYPSAVPGLPDVNRMTPQDQAQWSNLMIGVGGITGGEGAGAAERTAARGLPPNEALGPGGPQPGQLPLGTGLGQELPHGGPPPPVGGYEAPNIPQPGQLQLESELPYGGPRPTGTEAQGAIGPLTGQMRLPGFPNPQTATPLELFRAYHTGNVVSSPATAVHVALNSVISPVWSLGTHSVADLLGGTLNAATGAPTGNLGRAVGRGAAVGSAMAEFGRNLAQGFSEFYANPTNVANKIDNPLASGLLKAQQAVGAALHSSFQNASQAATARLELAAEAGERAWAEGTRGQDLMNRIGELMTNPTPQMVARAQDVGTRAALRGSAGGTQQVMQKIAEIPFIGNALFPVVRIGAQSIAQGVEKSPLGLVGTGFDVARAAAGKGPYAGPGGFSQVGGAVTPLADRLTNNLAGTALTTFLTFKALDGTITGNGPDDPKARSMLQSQGWQPNSVLVPGRGYMDYHALGPLAIPFSIAGNIGDSILYSKPQPGESGGDQVKAATLDLTRRVADYLASGTGMRTIGDMWDLIHGGANASAVGAQFVGSVAGGFVPMSAAVRAGVSSTDPFQRRAAAGNVQQVVQQGLPGGTPLIGGRQDLPIRQDVLGRPEANPQQGIGAALPRTGAGQSDPMLMLLSRAGIELPATAPKTISYSGRQIQLTPDEQQQRQTLFGQRLQQTLQGYLKSEKFQSLSPDQQYKALEPVVRAAGTYADQRLVAEMPAADRKARMATAPRAYGAGVVPYLAAGSTGGLAGLIARQSGAEADAAHQRLIAQYSSQPAQPQLAAVS